MPVYEVVIIKNQTTVIKVTADSHRKAREQVRTYGLVEAVSDYPVFRETVTSKIQATRELSDV